MKIGKIVDYTGRTLTAGSLATAAATQVGMLAHAGTAAGIVNASGVALGSFKAASVGYSLLGPLASGASAVFGATTAAGTPTLLASATTGLFGVGLISTFIVPAIAIGMAFVAYKLFSEGSQQLGETVDGFVASREAAAGQKQQAAETAKATQLAQEKLAPTAAKTPDKTKEPAWHPAHDAEKRGVSYRDNVRQSQQKNLATNNLSPQSQL